MCEMILTSQDERLNNVVSSLVQSLHVICGQHQRLRFAGACTQLDRYRFFWTIFDIFKKRSKKLI